MLKHLLFGTRQEGPHRGTCGFKWTSSTGAPGTHEPQSYVESGNSPESPQSRSRPASPLN